MRAMSRYGQYCPITRALEVLGDRWTLLVIRDLLVGATRFNELARGLPGMSRALLSRLRKLVKGVLKRVPYQEDGRTRHEYRLTEKGRDLYPVVVSLLRWGDKWMNDGSGPPVELRHRECGHAMVPELACPECGDWLEARDVEVVTK